MNVIRLHHCSHCDAYAVNSESTSHLVHVVLHKAARRHESGGEWACGCQWGSSGRTCSHILAVQAFEEHEDDESDAHRDLVSGIKDALNAAWEAQQAGWEHEDDELDAHEDGLSPWEMIDLAAEQRDSRHEDEDLLREAYGQLDDGERRQDR